ncbi:MAG: response regulator transcription factor [Christiangramia sp.]|nr:response regulator [Christiangramia sp.]|tara:strand:- start:216 stop:581 length:366 start_codon:yes stop_codon:yes gene_type:complete
MKRILVVEDNPMIVKSLEFKLRQEGYEVLVAQDGRQGVELMQNNEIDLLLTDLMLPFVNGIQLIEQAKQKDPDLPIIVLSTSKQENIIMDAFNLGVEDFITKPFNPNELSLRVKRSLRNAD